MPKAEINAGAVTYTGLDKKNNGKIWTTQRENGKYTYVHCQVTEFSQPFICIVAVTKDMLPDYEQYLLEFPRSAREKIMTGETGYTFWHGGNTYWYFNKDEAVKKATHLLENTFARVIFRNK